MRSFTWQCARGAAVLAVPLAVVLGGLGPDAEPASVAPRGTGEITVEARGLRVVGAAYDSRQDMRPFNYFSGTNVVLLATRPTGGLIRMDDGASQITKFADDRGKSLLVKGEFAQPGLLGFPQISGDGKAAMLEVFGGALPTSGATRVSIEGSLVFDVATTQETHRHVNVRLEKDAKIRTGPIEWTVESVGKPEWGDEPFALTLALQQDISRVAEIRFTGADGTAIEYRDGGTRKSRVGDIVTVTRTFRLVAEVESVTVEIDYWADMHSVTVPLVTSVTLGL